jgi:hypothetical protein
VTNIVGLVAAVLGDKFYWWFDPVGAIILALYTIGPELYRRMQVLLPLSLFPCFVRKLE